VVMTWQRPTLEVRRDARMILETSGVFRETRLDNPRRRAQNALTADALALLGVLVPSFEKEGASLGKTAALVEMWKTGFAAEVLNDVVNTVHTAGVSPVGMNKEAMQVWVEDAVRTATVCLYGTFVGIHQRLNEHFSNELALVPSAVVVDRLRRAWSGTLDCRAETAVLEVAHELCRTFPLRCAELMASLLQAGHHIEEAFEAARAVEPEAIPANIVLLAPVMKRQHPSRKKPRANKAKRR